MTKEELYAHPGWQWCTSEGSELHTLLIGLETTFREKLEWLEEAETLTLIMKGEISDRKLDIPEIVSRCATDLKLDLIAVYLFGSYGTAHQNEESDLDLAVLAERPLTIDDRFSLIESIQQSAEKYLSIDILDLSCADSVIAVQVITEGSRIMTISATKADYFEAYALSRYAHLNEERKDLLSDIVNRGSIYHSSQK